MKFVVAFLAICTTTQAYLPHLDGKIVGGQEVDIIDFPYQVSFRRHDRHICGGSIINEDTILTAGHCIRFSGASLKYSVRVGNNEHANGTHYKVIRIIKNSDFNPKTLDYDIAIAKLEQRLSYSDTVQPIELQPMGVEIPAGSTAWVSGWGITSEESQSVSAFLYAVDVSFISSESCSDAYKGQITSTMVCALTVDHDSCQGDSGGPLVYDEKLIGVVSWGYGCARPNYPGVYTKVSALYDWIVINAN